MQAAQTHPPDVDVPEYAVAVALTIFSKYATAIQVLYNAPSNSVKPFAGVVSAKFAATIPIHNSSACVVVAVVPVVCVVPVPPLVAVLSKNEDDNNPLYSQISATDALLEPER